MKIIRHARYADYIMKVEGALAVAGVGGGVLLWAQASHFGGYGFAAAAFLGLGGVNAGVKAMRNYNRYLRGVEGEEAVISQLASLPDNFICISNFVVPGTKHGDSDLLVLGNFGILVIEVKKYTGHYACHGDTWYRIHDNGVRQPLRTSVSRQLKRNIKAVQHYLVDCDIEASVFGALVFQPSAQLDISHPTVPILDEKQIINYIKDIPPHPKAINIDQLRICFEPSAEENSFRRLFTTATIKSDL